MSTCHWLDLQTLGWISPGYAQNSPRSLVRPATMEYEKSNKQQYSLSSLPLSLLSCLSHNYSPPLSFSL